MPPIAPVTSLVFIDSTVVDYQSLIDGLVPGTEAIVLDSAQDGVEQITATLASRSDIQSVHIVSHGSSGNLKLGAATLNGASIDRYQAQLQGWRSALTEDADILIYGCDVAAGITGSTFVEQLSQLTGADVAASNDATGSATLGGDWDLEAQTGAIEATSAFQSETWVSYGGILPIANDTAASAIALTLNAPVNGSTVGGTNDYQLVGATGFTGIGQTPSTAAGLDAVYSFTASSADTYSFRIKKPISAENLILYVADSTTMPTGTAPLTVTPLSAANRKGGGANEGEEIVGLSLTAGQTVYVVVDAASGTAGSAFSIEVNRAVLETEPNNTPATANPFVQGIEGAIATAGEADFFSLGTPTAGSRVFAMIDGIAGNDDNFDLRVTTATDTLEYDDLNGDAQFGGLSPVIAGTPLTGANTYLCVNHYNPATTAEPYRLYSVVQPALASAITETEANDTLAGANSNALNYFSGSLSTTTDVDLYRFNASAGDLIFLALDTNPLRDNTPFNSALALLDAAGTSLILVNDADNSSSTTSGAGSLNSTNPRSSAEGLVYRVTTTGTYYAKVNLGGGSTVGDYLLSIAGNIVPNSAPVLDNSGTPTLTAIAEDVLPADNTGTKVSDLINGLITDADGDPKAIAITGVDNTKGTWQYSTDGGTIWTDFSATSADSTATVLGATSFYQASLSTAPTAQGQLSFTNLNPIPPAQLGTQTFDSSGAILNTDVDKNIYAGYGNFSGATPVNPPLPKLDNVKGYSVSFNLQLLTESHTNPDRAGFSIIVVSNDKTQAIELGFQDGKIFAQKDAGFTAGENALFNTKQSIDYRLEVLGSSYTLFANNASILTGALRNYSVFSGAIDPYETPNFIFLGDDSTSAKGSFNLSQVVVQTDNRVRFVPNANANGNSTINFRAWDTTNGGIAGAIVNASVNGGITPFSSNSATATVTVNPINDAPTISGTPAVTIAEDSLYSFTPSAIDVDLGTALTFAITNQPTWATFAPATGKLSGTPTNGDVGTTTGIIISVSDGVAPPVTLPAFNLTVTNTNDAPTISGTPAVTIAEDSLYSFTPSAIDVDLGATLTFSIANKPTWATFDTTTGELSGTPVNGDVGTTTGIVIGVRDGTTSVDLPSFNLAVTNINDAPTLTNAIADQSATEDTLFTFAVPTNTFTDVDAGDTLTYTATQADNTPLPSWLSFNTTNKTFSGTPLNAQVGSLSVKVKATDIGLSTAEDIFKIDVANTNDAPTVTNAIADQTLTQDALFTFTLPTNTFTDVDAGDTLTYTATLANSSPLPTWLTFSSTTRTFSGTPRNANVGSLDLKVKATDKAGATAEDGFIVKVANINRSPVIGTPITPAPQQVTATQPFTLKIPTGAFTDPDAGDTLTFSASLESGALLPSWLIFDAKTGLFSGSPDIFSVGNLSLKVNATDAQGLKTSQLVKLAIANPTGITGTPTALIDFSGGKKGITLKAKKGQLLRGTSRSDILKGTKGSDRINSSGRRDSRSKDKLYGFDGNDRLEAGGGNDYADGGRGNDFLQGSKGRDLLRGSDGIDRLLGGKGDDLLIGGNSADILIGGKGRDMFVFGNVNEGKDAIADFTPSEDLIDLRSLFSQPQFAGATSYVRYLKCLQLTQVGASTEIKVDADGIGVGSIFTTLATLNNIGIGAVSSRNFVIS